MSENPKLEQLLRLRKRLAWTATISFVLALSYCYSLMENLLRAKKSMTPEKFADNLPLYIALPGMFVFASIVVFFISLTGLLSAHRKLSNPRQSRPLE